MPTNAGLTDESGVIRVTYLALPSDPSPSAPPAQSESDGSVKACTVDEHVARPLDSLECEDPPSTIDCVHGQRRGPVGEVLTAANHVLLAGSEESSDQKPSPPWKGLSKVNTVTGQPEPVEGMDPSLWSLRVLFVLTEPECLEWLRRGWLLADLLSSARSRLPSSGDNALHACATKGWALAASRIADKCPELLNRPNHAQRTPLFVARARSNHSVATCLQQRGGRLLPDFLRGQIDDALAGERLAATSSSATGPAEPEPAPALAPGRPSPGRSLLARMAGAGTWARSADGRRAVRPPRLPSEIVGEPSTQAHSRHQGGQ